MRLLSTFLFSFVFLSFNSLQAQTSKDVTVPLTATVAAGPTVTLNWVNPGNAGLLIRRRTKGLGGSAWTQIINLASSNLTSVIDNGVTAGQVYEYVIQRNINSLNAFGYAHVAINANVIDSRGKILIFVDSTTADALGPQLVRLKNDLRGDGWWPIPFHTGPYATVKSIKDQIVASYNADPTKVKAVLLLGTIPIPYSGNTAWDGHGDHQGAWPSDAYYADVNGNWTDTTVNNITPGRAANVNIPGDGKFDQSYLPGVVELQIGRVDFRHINAIAFGEADQIGLMRRYLDKDHKWRIGDYPVENKALVDDNFGYFGGEAFGSNGFRNAYPLVGEANIVETDFFEGTESQSYLLGYGCGGGNYNGAGGVGSSSNFATDTINIVFSNMFGSYFGDWDYESDPFLPSALASRGGILTCSWAGRPHWFNQALASGESIGYCTKETMNAQYNTGYMNSFGKGGAHMVLLGDPTLRAHVLKPATEFTVSNQNCHSVELNWKASEDSVAGYHIYRALSQDGPYTRLTTNLVTGTTYTDNSPVPDTLYYQVRAIRNVTSPGGGIYANNAIGPIESIVFALPPQVNATASGFSLNCFNLPVQLQSGNNDPGASYAWTGPNNFTSTFSDPTTFSPGNYVVVVTLGACSATDAVDVLSTTLVVLSVVTTDETVPNANNGAIDLSTDGGIGPFTYLWSNAATTEDLSALTGGNYTVTVTDVPTGCSSIIIAHVSTTSGTDEAALFEQFQVSPNPTKGLASLFLKLHKTATIQVDIRDSAGRLIWKNQPMQTAVLNLPIDLTQSPAGLYTISFKIENQVFVRKLTVVK